MQWRPRFRRTTDERGPVTSFVVVAGDNELAYNRGELNDNDVVIQPPMHVDYQHGCGGTVEKGSIRCNNCNKISRSIAPKGEANPTIMMGTTDFTQMPWFKEMWPDVSSSLPATRTYNSAPESTPEPTATTVSTDGPGSEHHPIIQKAIDNQHEIELIYQKEDSPPEQRVIIPREIATNSGNVTYFRGFDITKQGGHKLFRTDHIKRIIDVRDRSQDPGVDPESFSLKAIPQPRENKNRTLLADEPSLVTSDQTIKKNNPNGARVIADPVQFMQDQGAYRPKTGDIEPTPEEYEELRSKDVDPQTHDKATVRRLRNKGASHVDLLNVASQGIPYEDYEDAMAVTDSHDSAVQEALKMRSRDREQIAQNLVRNKENPNFAEPHLLDDADYKAATRGLFVHHMNLRNAPSFSPDQNLGPIFNHPDRRRANEWIMSELTKINPELKSQMGNSKFLENRGLEILKGSNVRLTDGTRQISYFEPVNQLTKHHEALKATTTDLKDLTKHRRIIKALSNIGNSRFYPVDYNGDVYEEA
jgi:hypothetical protein